MILCEHVGCNPTSLRQDLSVVVTWRLIFDVVWSMRSHQINNACATLYDSLPFLGGHFFHGFHASRLSNSYSEMTVQVSGCRTTRRLTPNLTDFLSHLIHL